MVYPVRPGPMFGRVANSGSLFSTRNALNTKRFAFDFRASSVTLSGGRVTAAADLTGGGATATPPGTGPIWNASGLHGLPTIEGAASEYLTLALPTPIASGSRPDYYIVSKHDQTVTDQLPFHQLNVPQFMYIGRAASSVLSGAGRDTANFSFSGTPNTNWRRHGLQFRSAGHRFHVDGSVASTSGNTGTTDAAQTNFGLLGTTSGTLRFDGQLAYCDGAAAAPSDADWTTGDTAAKTVYGL